MIFKKKCALKFNHRVKKGEGGQDIKRLLATRCAAG